MDSTHANDLKGGGKLKGERTVTIGIFRDITKLENLRVYILGL